MSINFMLANMAAAAPSFPLIYCNFYREVVVSSICFLLRDREFFPRTTQNSSRITGLT